MKFQVATLAAALLLLHFNTQIFDNEFLAFGGIFTHIIFKQIFDGIAFVQGDRFKPHVFTYERLELVG